jgi:hypothetical protein
VTFGQLIMFSVIPAEFYSHATEILSCFFAVVVAMTSYLVSLR